MDISELYLRSRKKNFFSTSHCLAYCMSAPHLAQCLLHIYSGVLHTQSEPFPHMQVNILLKLCYTAEFPTETMRETTGG